MLNKTAVLLASLFLVFSVSGCATGHKQANFENQGLKNQISVLQTQIQAKDEEIDNLKESLHELKKEKTATVKSQPNAKRIQTCLKNAGYNPGNIDGTMGKQTRRAIRAFQKDNGLEVDGNVGKQTWKLLKKYLNEKVK